jgi:hypothetical protein
VVLGRRLREDGGEAGLLVERALLLLRGRLRLAARQLVVALGACAARKRAASSAGAGGTRRRVQVACSAG